MSISAITNGVTASPQVTEGAPIVVLPTSEPMAIGRSYGEYEEGYARLRVFDADDSTDKPQPRAVPASPRVLANGVAIYYDIDYILLQSLTEVFVERMAPVYTFGAAIIQSSGSDAKQFVYMGVVIPNSLDGDGRTRFVQSYNDILRVSRLVTKTHRRYVELYYRNQIRRGYITSLSAQTSAEVPNRVELTFSMFVTDVLYENNDPV